MNIKKKEKRKDDKEKSKMSKNRQSKLTNILSDVQNFNAPQNYLQALCATS